MTPETASAAVAVEASLYETEVERRKRLSFLGFTDEDARRLLDIGSETGDLIDVAVERFYEHLMRFEVRHLIEDRSVLERVKDLQRQYLRELFSGRYDQEYFQRRLRIGEAHVRIGLGIQWFLGIYNVYRACFIPRILERFRHEPDGGAAHLVSFDKILTLDGELALDAYVHAYTRDLRGLKQELEARNVELRRYSGELQELVSERTKELRLSEEKYRGIVDHAADAIILVDMEEVIRSWNRGATTMFGYTPEEILGRKFYMLLPPEATAELDYIRSEVEKHGVLKNFETVRVAKDGRRVYVSLTRTLLRNEAGEPIGCSAILRDITAIRTFEERMYRAERLASLGWLASEIAHEVGTPLNVISGRAEHLLRALPDGDAKRRPLQIIVSQIDRISRVMTRALQIVREPRATDGAEPRCPIAEGTQEVLEFFEVKLVSRRIAVKRDLQPLVLAMNGLDLEQLLFNLIQNSIDAMPQGGTLTLEAHARDGEAVVSVVDTGIGIPYEHLDRIFEPLFTTKESGHGTGLGLALVSRIIRRYRGFIDVESEPGKGATFRLRLPLSSA